MGKENRPKNDNMGWIKALLFPKKSKPIATVQPAKFESASPTPGPGPVKPSSPAEPALAQPAAPPPARVTLSQPATSATAAPPQAAAASRAQASRPAAENPPAAANIPTSPRPASQPKKRSFMPAFWTIASILSLIVNLILIIVLLVLGRELFTLKTLVGDELLGGLYNNFVLMDEAHIQTTIEVQTEIPVQFSLPVQTETIVQLTADTPINGARVTLSTGGLNIISAPTNIILPAGTNLPILLDITVPVNTTIPITLQVPVDIPLEETELHQPFTGLQAVVGPYYKMLNDLPGPQEIGLCESAMWFCKIFFNIE
ncbi:MAG: hypothetical protein RBS68_14225 [Anaerolineales bacterium]|jgi:hypothetical protein|nr:hypothetical protein [Anaerolineales bacterium]